MGIIIKNGEIVTAEARFRGDLRLDEGVIQSVGKELAAQPGDETIDAEGRYVLPGAVDVHTHLDLPFMGTFTSDDFETGTVGAICGGTTTIVDFAIQPKGGNLKKTLEDWHAKAEGKAACDYGFHIAITDFNERVAAEIPEVVAQGVTSFKAFMAYKGALMVDDEQLLKILLLAREHGALVSIHGENGDIVDLHVKRYLAEGKTEPKWHPLSRPAVAEGEATGRAITLAALAGAPLYIVHLSSRLALEEVRQARARGQAVYAETCPQYLLLDLSYNARPGFEGAKWVMSPPLREVEDQEKLWTGLAHDYLQVVATDHAPFNFKGQKEMGRDDFSKIPNGCPGLEDRFDLMHTYGVEGGRFDLRRLVQVCCTNPARLFGLHPRKGTLAPGSDADVVVYDPQAEGTFSAATQHQRCDFNSYEGFRRRGAPEVVIVGGQIAYRQGEFLGRAGSGRFLARQRFEGPFPLPATTPSPGLAGEPEGNLPS